MISYWQKGLAKWRSDRNITEPSGNIVMMIHEEVTELHEAEINKDEHEIVDALADIIVLSVNELELMGYDVDGVMNEVVKEISSRNQCPKQKEDWDKNGVNGKWLKDMNQNDTYKAKYNG